MKDKKLQKYILLIGILFAVIVALEMSKKEPTDWSPTFINSDKMPYGTYIVFDLLKDVFPEGKIRASRYPITNELKYYTEAEVEYEEDEYYDDYEGVEENGYESEDLAESPSIEKANPSVVFKNTSYVFINSSFGIQNNLSGQNFGVDKLDIKNLFNFVKEGNNVFIAAENITPLLLDSLQLKVEKEWSSTDTTYLFSGLGEKKYSFSALQGGLNYVALKDSADRQIDTLAYTKDKAHAVFVRLRYGKGNIYINTLPVAFSNIKMLDTHKYDFAFTCLSYLPKSSNVIWDEYQKQGRVGEDSSFRVIWSHPALLWAYYIALIGGLLFLIFRSKRTQRIIPVVEPPKNTSLEFLDTISNLYEQKQAYESIVEKRHNYFLDLLRSKYYWRAESINSEMIEVLSSKSGVEASIIQTIFSLHTEAEQAHYVSNTLLLKYNEALEMFYRKMK